jgi:hypothetical protein
MLVIATVSGDTLYEFSTITDADFLNMHEHFIPDVASSTNCRFVVSAWESDYALRLSKELNVTINP